MRPWHAFLPCTSPTPCVRTPILLLPGACSNACDLPLSFLQRLRAHAPVILYDHRDSGRSGAWTESPYALSDLADDATDVLAARRVTRAHVVGISMGGVVAQLMALQSPERVASLGLLMTTPGGAGLSPPTPRAVECIEREVALYRRGEFATGLRVRWDTHRGMHGVEEARRDVDGRCERVLRHGFRPLSHHVPALMSEPSRMDRLARVACPTRVVHGREDSLFPHDHASALASAVPTAQLHVLDGVGHDLHAGNADAWADALVLDGCFE